MFTNDVANLIMIGTPNDGSPLSELSDIYGAAVYDLRRGASATRAEQNPNTDYYTISRNWCLTWEEIGISQDLMMAG